MESIYGIDQIDEAANLLLQLIENGHRKLAFEGEMGAGKTTLISALCKLLDVEDAVSSPTFAIINEYFSPKYGAIYHMDLYRLSGELEAENAGVEDMMLSDAICLVEWPKIAPNMTSGAIRCKIEIMPENKRKLSINA